MKKSKTFNLAYMPEVSRISKRIFLFVFSLGAASASFAAEPSFACTRSLNETEQAICDSHHLSGLDSQLASAYRAAISFIENAELLANEQKAWLASRDTCGGNEDCISKQYLNRLSVLSDWDAIASTNLPSWLKLGKYLPISEPASSPDAPPPTLSYFQVTNCENRICLDVVAALARVAYRDTYQVYAMDERLFAAIDDRAFYTTWPPCVVELTYDSTQTSIGLNQLGSCGLRHPMRMGYIRGNYAQIQ